MASIARGLSRRTNPYDTPCNHIITIALQSFILRTFSYNALSFHDHDPHHAFKPLNPPKTLKPRKNSQLKSPNEEIKKTADDNTDDQLLWSLDRKDKTPIHSPLPFDFKYSYSESNPNLTPIGFREKKFSPFGPGRIDRKWTGWYAAAPQQAKRNADTFRKHREEVLGDPLTEEEIAELVEKYGRSNCDRQINLDVGPVRPADYARNRRHPWPGAAPAAAGGPAVAGELPAGEVERVLRRVERNFTSLTRTVPMAKIEDLPPSMQPHVVGAPQTWVRLFRCLANAVDQYNRAHRP